MNIVIDDCHLSGIFFLGGGGEVNLEELNQQAYFDHFLSISTDISQGIIIFHIN